MAPNRKTGALAATLLCGLLVVGGFQPTSASPHARPTPTPTPNPPVVINFAIIPASRGASILHSIYPYASITIDSHANAAIVVASGYDEQGMRTIASGIDVKNPTDTATDTYQTKVIAPQTAASRLAGVFPGARVLVAPNRTVIIMASPSDMAQIKSILTAIDTAPPTPTPKPRYPAEAVRVTQRNVSQVARAVAVEAPTIKVRVSGSEILLSGPPDDVEHAKTLIAQMDVPQLGTQYTEVYRIKWVDANSVAQLFQRSFSNLQVEVNADLNAITVSSNLTVQRRIADALAQLDVPPPGANGQGNDGPSTSPVDVVHLRAGIPAAAAGGASTYASDIANTVTQALQGSASDLKIVVPPNANELVLSGSPYSIKLAKDLIDKLDVPQTMVALDTEVLEVDEGKAQQIGLQFPTAAVSTTLTEVAPLYPTTNAAAGTQIPYLNLMPLIRTPMSLEAVMNFLVSTNYAKILENPRITTISGRTASLRAGETVNILTTAGGSAGTVATTQVQSFQTGVTLDITPVVNEDDYITLTLHPSVNSIAAISSAGVPNIQTRDTTTTVGVHDGETIVIGGLIEDLDQQTIDKIPILGDIPLIGKFLFQYHNIQKSRNELVVTVTPHIVRAGENGAIGKSSLGIPRPDALPTLPPNAQIPPRRSGAIPPPEPAYARPSPAPEPQPVSVPTPYAVPNVSHTPPPGGVSTTPPPGGVIPTPTPPGMPGASPSPAPLPSAFSQTNVYTYGQAPQNNFAQPNAAPQIFYVQVSPSVVRNGQTMTISAITSTNVTNLKFGPNAILPMTTLQSVGSGQWSSTFEFSSAGLPIGQSNATLTLTGTTNIGGTVSLPIPMSLISP